MESSNYYRAQKVREPIIKGEVAYIPLANGDHAIVDVEYAFLAYVKSWCRCRDKRGAGQLGYASTCVLTDRKSKSGKPLSQQVLMHQCVMGMPMNGMEVDHRNHDKLDNRKSNLRYIVPRGNYQNNGGWHPSVKPSGLPRNVYLHKGRYRVMVKAHYVPIPCGTFGTLEEADSWARSMRALFLPTFIQEPSNEAGIPHHPA